MKSYRQVISFLLSIAMLISMMIVAYANDQDSAVDNGWIHFEHGGSIFIPSDFENIEWNEEYLTNQSYSFANYDQEMVISLEEWGTEAYFAEEDIINNEYYECTESFPEAVYNVKNKNDFTLSGYDGDYIYYLYCIMANHTVYKMLFYYPTSNRNYCDPVVEKTCDSFTTEETGHGDYEQGDNSQRDLVREVCWKCNGKGRCTYCYGTGRFLNTYGRDPYYQDCPFCAAHGLCYFCAGYGYIEKYA